MSYKMQLASTQYGSGYTVKDTFLQNQTWNDVTYLEPLHQSVTTNGEISELHFRAIGAGNSLPKHPEDVLSMVPRYKGVRVIDTSNSDAVRFEGVILKHHIHMGGTQEDTILIAHGIGDNLLYRICLHGQHRLSYAKEKTQFEIAKSDTPVTLNDADVVRIDTPLIFNPGGEPNMSQQMYSWNEGGTFGDNAGNSFPIFDAPFRTQKNDAGNDIKSVPWTLSAAVRYLLNCYPAFMAIDPDTYNEITSTLSIIGATEDPVISNVNLEGKSLIEALAILLTPYNFGFSVGFSGSPQPITFFSRTHPQSSGAVLCSVTGAAASSSNANMIDATITIDGSGVVNNITAIGDRIEYTTLCHTRPPAGSKLLTLVPGWKSTHLKWAFSTTDVVNPLDLEFRTKYNNDQLVSKIENPGSTTKYVYGVGRMWVVNQGQVAQTSDHPLEDLTTDLATAADIADPTTFPYTSMDRRRLEAPELYANNSENALLNPTDIVVEMSTDGGQNWRIVDAHWYKVLPAEVGMGFVFTDTQKLDRLGYANVNGLIPDGKGYWQSLYDRDYLGGGHNTTALELRILCKVKSDQRVKSVNPNHGSASPLATERIFTNDGYQHMVYNDKIADAVYFEKYPPSKNVRDDTEQLHDLASVQLDALDREMTSGQIVVLTGTMGTYVPGMAITEITNRIAFESPPIVMRVLYDYANQHTTLVVDNKHHRTILKAPVLDGQSAQQSKMGIGSLQTLQGGHQGPLPTEGGLRHWYKEGNQ